MSMYGFSSEEKQRLISQYRQTMIEYRELEAK